MKYHIFICLAFTFNTQKKQFVGLHFCENSLKSLFLIVIPVLLRSEMIIIIWQQSAEGHKCNENDEKYFSKVLIVIKGALTELFKRNLNQKQNR